jgi:selenocysteine-specific elongation factor
VERLILGTAGHIDHGKTTLVRALTGVDCDRLPEEKSRGITIELGFAPLALPSGARLGVVDVPGHERLVRTMVAGATGIDVVLIVVAADEGIMPQSREHLAICELLGVSRGVVAVTKIDAVDEDLRELVRLEVEEELSGSALAGCPIVPVSARTGEGLDDLIAALEAVIASAPARTLRDGPAWLPVDRVFTMKGFGTVVTGTLRGAPLEEGAAVQILPEPPGVPLEARIRGLQVHGELVAVAEPGSRCALNLQGIDLSAVPRGSLLATPDRVDYRRRVDVELGLVREAPPLRSSVRATVHVGTTERGARVRLLDREVLQPGERGLAELRFERPLAVVEGDRFILRGYARLPGAGWTVGGGRVLDAAPHPGRRPRAERVADLTAMASDDRRAALSARLRRARLFGVLESDLRRQVRSLADLDGVRVGTERWLHAESFDELVARCTAAVAAHHEGHPVDPWVGLASVAAALPAHVAEESVRAALQAAAERGELEASGSGYRRPGHAAHVADPALAGQVRERLVKAGLAPENLEGLARDLGRAPDELRPVLDHLTRAGELVRVSAGLYFGREHIDALRARVSAYLAEHGTIDPAAYKGVTGQTRKFTVPLMEHFDAVKLTVRRGNTRTLRNPRRENPSP